MSKTNNGTIDVWEDKTNGTVIFGTGSESIEVDKGLTVNPTEKR